MIRANFYINHDGDYAAFVVKGHAGTARHGEDILCAAVTSAVMLTINTVTDSFHVKSKVGIDRNKAGLLLLADSHRSSLVIKSLAEHLMVLNLEYKKIDIRIKPMKKGSNGK